MCIHRQNTVNFISFFISTGGALLLPPSFSLNNAITADIGLLHENNTLFSCIFFEKTVQLRIILKGMN